MPAPHSHSPIPRNTPPPLPPPQPPTTPTTPTTRFARSLRAKALSSLAFITTVGVAKAVVAYLLAYVVAFAPPVIDAFKTGTALIPIGVLIFHPVRSLGSMIELLLVGCLGVGVGTAIAVTAELLVVQWNLAFPDEMSGGWIYALSSFTSITILSWFKVSFPRLEKAAVAAYITIIFGLTVGISSTEFSFGKFSSIIVPLLLSLGISFVTCFTVFPTAAQTQYRSLLCIAIKDIRTDFKALTTTFLDVATESKDALDANTMPETLAAHLNALKTLDHEARYEFSRSVLAPKTCFAIGTKLGQLSHHLSGIRGAIRSKSMLSSHGNTKLPCPSLVDIADPDPGLETPNGASTSAVAAANFKEIPLVSLKGTHSF